MYKVLQIIPTLNRCGGVENYIMNYYSLMKDEFIFDFVYHRELGESFDGDPLLKNSKIFKLPEFKMKNLRKIKKMIIEIIKNNDYDIIHCHMANAAFLYFKIAKKYGIDVRIIHSHQSSAADRFTHKLRNYPLLFIGKKRATKYIACSKKAGDFLFKRNYTVINNAINIEKFFFNKEERATIRNNLKIDDNSICIGHIGRFSNQKNHIFMIKLMKYLISVRNVKNIKLVLVGDGLLKNEIQCKIEEEKLGDYIILVGSVNDAYRYYNAFDIFILPSLYEGLPVVGVEAQYNGLEIIASQNITEELNFSGKVRYLSLSNLERWADAISECTIKNRNKEYYEQYDINKQSSTLTELYKNEIVVKKSVNN